MSPSARHRHLLWLLALLIAACGGDGSRPAVTPTPPTASNAPAGSAAATEPGGPLQPPLRIFQMPQEQQLEPWRRWARQTDPAGRSQGLRQLALLGDPRGVELCIAALEHGPPEVRLVAAQALAHYGLPAAAAAKPALLDALAETSGRLEQAIIWALVVLQEPQVFSRFLAAYQEGELPTLPRLRGGRALSIEPLATLAPAARWASFAGKSSVAVRQLVAQVLAHVADPQWISQLARLATDQEIDVARAAIGALASIPDVRAKRTLTRLLSSANLMLRKELLFGVRALAGGPGLALGLEGTPLLPEPQHWEHLQWSFRALQDLGDPRAADGLLAWADAQQRHAHWRGQVGLRLAELGDVRAAPLLAERMRLDSSAIYDPNKRWQAGRFGHLSRSDEERIHAARLLADLAMLHPGQRQQLTATAADSVHAWLHSRPAPHANGLRFLAAVQAPQALSSMRAWAFPTDPFPAVGAQPPFPRAYETAHAALRYLGRYQDAPSLSRLLAQFQRKPPGLDISMDALMGTGMAMRGMAMRAVSVGAADGLSEWGPSSQASAALMTLIEDPKWIEDARANACVALGWVADAQTMAKVAKRVRQIVTDPAADPQQRVIAQHYATTLAIRPTVLPVSELVDLLLQTSGDTRLELVLAIGRAGLAETPDQHERLVEALADPEARTTAALALVLGSPPTNAAQTFARYAEQTKGDTLALHDPLARVIGRWLIDDLSSGIIYRWVENAFAIARVELARVPQTWMLQRLASTLENQRYDRGPHTLNSRVLRQTVYLEAKKATGARRRAAIHTLQLMQAEGALMALRTRPGATGKLAAQALHALRNPIPEPATDDSP